ncbi:hypothetical protein PVK06_026748 [Gossypium arboreum]|uniref:Uncharacterized protein n=1 Tax=Gossypium arboreum TaxID=29729 RepID=A0ABR0NZ23_GOSAR|nr:hypothetical protein PVK06_026748 [Gossypium arboreum]
MNIWHVKVPLVNYATVEMHQMDRVLRQFGFQQSILVAPKVLNDEHKIDLRKLKMNWPVFFSEYIKIWKNWYDHIPTHKPNIVPELACASDYMPWFKIHGWNAWPGASLFLMTPTQPTIYRPSSQEGSHEAPSRSLSHYQSPLHYGIQTPLSWVMQHLCILYSIKVGHPPNTHNQNNRNPHRKLNQEGI